MFAMVDRHSPVDAGRQINNDRKGKKLKKKMGHAPVLVSALGQKGSHGEQLPI